MINQPLKTNQNSKIILEKFKKLLDIVKENINNNMTSNQNEIIEFENNFLAWNDIDTGLIWELKTKENIENIYNWDDAFEYVKLLNDEIYCGFDNWRIPTKEELKTLITKNKNDNFYIKKPLSKNTDWAYWSSIEDIKNGLIAYSCYFNYGDIRKESKKFKCYIRCVTNSKVR